MGTAVAVTEAPADLTIDLVLGVLDAILRVQPERVLSPGWLGIGAGVEMLKRVRPPGESAFDFIDHV